MTISELLTLAAILVGPLAAVVLTRSIDSRRERNDRRMDVFRTLMRTRRAPTMAEHVGALNLIEIEFAKDAYVLGAWKNLFSHFASEHIRRPHEARILGDTVENQRRDDVFYKRLGEERQRLLSKLLHAMGKALNFKIEQLEIFEGGYIPQGWEDELNEQRIVRRFFVELFRGRAALPVIAVEQAADANRSVPDTTGISTTESLGRQGN